MNRIVYVGKHALTMAVSRHLHNCWELIYCTSGSALASFDDREIAYAADDILMIPPLLPHSNASRDGFTNIHINLTDTTLTHTEPVLIHADPNGFLRNAFSAAFYYFSEGAAGAQTLLPLYRQLIVASLALAQPNGQHSETIQRIENDILQHYPDRGYDLNAFLSELPFNTEYLKKMFKKATGLTPHQYLTDKRLESAASILATYCGKGNISETARLCGFSDPLYFSRMFKKKYGVPPRGYIAEESPHAADPDSMKIMV